MKILLLGGSGILGSDCREVLSMDFDVISPDEKDLDITIRDAVIDSLQQISPDIILNCAGISDVDRCEVDSLVIRKVNVDGPRNLAQGSARFKSRLVQISSDYVFNGRRVVPQPYFEDDQVDPISTYGKSKMESEVAVRENSPDYIILRTSWLYGLNGDDFIDYIITRAMKKEEALKVVDNQFISPTWTYTLALQIKELLQSNAKGIFHATSEGYCSLFEYARYILERLNLEASFEPCGLKDYPQAAKRPANCILENTRMKEMGLNVMPEWKKDVDRYLDQYGEALIKQANTEE